MAFPLQQEETEKRNRVVGKLSVSSHRSVSSGSLLCPVAPFLALLEHWRILSKHSQLAAHCGGIKVEGLMMDTAAEEEEISNKPMSESEKKLKFKEETAAAAIAGDTRASRLRDRVDELTRTAPDAKSCVFLALLWSRFLNNPTVLFCLPVYSTVSFKAALLIC
ncbi:hypothetical protein LINGRAHAP2_LOCUS32700 [Linum grandiflorum]